MKQHSMISQSIKSLKALLALSALLITSPSFAQNSPADHIHNKKSATYDYATGQGLITLESYVDGEVVDEHFNDPLDFVFVLDVSHSMCPFNNGDKQKYETVNQRVFLFGGDQIEYLHRGTAETNDIITGTDADVYKKNHDYKSKITIGGTTTMRYTVQFGGTGTYYNLAYFVNGTKYGGSDYPGGSGTGTSWSGTTGWYYSTNTTPSQSGTGTSARWKPYTPDANDKIYTDVKLDILENACRQLIDVIYANPPKSGSHRISVVTWAQQTTPVSNLILTNATAANKETLINSVTHLKTTAQTWPAVGLDQAKTNLGSSDRNKLVLFLTDGEPNDTYANILKSAKKLKDDTKTKIYSIALVADDTMNASRWNSETTRTIKDYLELVSSHYPAAESFSNKGTRKDDDTYYQHDTGANLVETFKKTGQSFIGGAGIEGLDSGDGVYLKDKINMENCVLVKTDGTDIKTYVAACIGKDGTELTFGNKVEVTNRDSLSVTVAAAATSQSIDVKGFDYSYNWCGYDAEHKTYHGMKLIVTIPFKMKAPGDGTFDLAKTNLAGSSLYKGDNTVDGAAFPIPEIPFTELTIQKFGLKAGDSAVYIIKKGDVEITRVILTGTDDSGSMVSIKLRILEPDVEYSVTETWWDYTYTQTSKDVTDNVFVFKSKKTSGMENEAEHRKVNDFS